jgi:hypothetical protein
MLRFSETPPSIHSPNTAHRLTAHYDLRRFHPENAARWLLAGVSESAPIFAGLLFRNQSDIAGEMLAAVEVFWSSNHKLATQCPQRTNSGMRHQQACHVTLLHFLFQRTRQLQDPCLKVCAEEPIVVTARKKAWMHF